jgi:hypothetical protein
MVTWPWFEKSFIKKEIQEGKQWKITEGNIIVCNWAITFNDRDIWGEWNNNNSIYIHRICNHPAYRGRRYINTITGWAKKYVLQTGRQFVRLDTLGKNQKLIENYTSAGFEFLGIFKLTNTASLPKHDQDESNCCLFNFDNCERNNKIQLS